MRKRKILFGLLLVGILTIGSTCSAFAAPSSWSSFPEKQYGDTGNFVMAIQLCLYDSCAPVRAVANNSGYTSKSAFCDSSFGATTKKVLLKFQSLYPSEIAYDGICGPYTWKKLQSVNNCIYHANANLGTYECVYLAGPISNSGETINMVKYIRTSDNYILKWQCYKNGTEYFLTN